MDKKRMNFDSAFLNCLLEVFRSNLPVGWTTENKKKWQLYNEINTRSFDSEEVDSDEVGFKLVGSDSVNSIRRIEWEFQRFEFLAEVSGIFVRIFTSSLTNGSRR
ncbi:hypothetical protein CEXT_799991 [Caerostris extrusa]|uniref:Uncharacterized protein n=1 Tax=Caerostris extrusa TaxID=172846 RepID=A0AAV4RFG4_CAEEX|nr:hypothetical protein CEXT_799991 [Caerostris extrusa]